MSKLSTADLRDMSDEELEATIEKLRSEIIRERAKVTYFGVSYADKSGIIRRVKRDLARALTIQNERKKER